VESGGDWRDPLSGEDEAARERERRRAEREARRRERQAKLGERVRESAEQAQPVASPPPEPSTPSPTDVVATPPVPTEETAALREPTAEAPAVPPPPPAEPAPPSEPPPAPAGRPPPGKPPRGLVARRRLAAVLGLAALAFVALVVVVAAKRLGGDDPPPAPPVKERPTESITIPEGYSRDQVAAVAKKAGIEGDYLNETKSFKGFDTKKYGVENPANLEGFLFPATYEVFKNATVDELIGKQLDAFEQNISSVDLSYAKSKNLTPYDVVIIASMIEREVQVPEERAKVASVIYNRLADGMPLGIDATIRFEDSNYDEQLLESRLAEDTPYNTRTNTGLPPGPIGNPGLDSLEAAANPAKTAYLYFVVKPGTCGEHGFYETDAEFAAAEQEYQAALQAEGGSPTEC